MRASLLVLVALAGCSSAPAADPIDAAAPAPEATEPELEVMYFNRTLQNVPFYGIDGTLFLVSAPGPGRVSEQIFVWEAPGELLEGHVRLTWSSATPLQGLALTMAKEGNELARAEGTGVLEFDLEGDIDGAQMWIQPAAMGGVAGAHLVVKWTLEITSAWLVDEPAR